MSNHAAPPQWVESVPYHDLRGMHGFARQWRDRHRGKWSIVRRLSGSCLLITRELYEAVGGLDERGGAEEAWADDLAARAQRAGFALAVAHDLFVHQRGDSSAGWTRVAASWDQVPEFFDFAAVYDAAVAAAKDDDVFVEVGCLAGSSTWRFGEPDPRPQRRSSQCRRPIDRLAIRLNRPGGLPAVGGSMAGILHRNILAAACEFVASILTTSNGRRTFSV